ncbi:MAG: sigma-70 family RNA polymerase sigma factor [Phycisphaerales bacterium]|nr:MAG: sigma-70 family RNA polymerase sigma factor [Phycisphaerales bacterium]
MTHAERVAAFDRLREKHLRFLTAVLWKLTGDRELFAEAMQYALLALWRHVEKLDTEKAASYIYRIALSANAKAWRQRIGRNGDIRPQPAGADDSPETRTDRADLVAQIRRTITRLPDRQSRALVMRYFEQKDYAAIAAHLGCSEAAARSHVSKAVATLRRKLAARQERDHGAA